MRDKREQISKALLKKALGYSVDEIVEEYNQDENENLKLVKKKITKKQLPPDMQAVRALLELKQDDDFSTYTDEQLLKERDKLLAIIQEEKGE